MSNRFGEKSRGTQPITGFSQRPTTAGGALTFNQQEFLAPGTWTKPANASWVWVFVVGGGGGGGASSGAPPANPLPLMPHSGGGGGGGVRSGWVPVSAPVPVTVGAGGTGAPLAVPVPTQIATVGGTTSFGPTFSVGGGGAGTAPFSAPFTPTTNAPTTGGGGGGGPIGSGIGLGGQYGFSVGGNPNAQQNGGAGVTSSNYGALGFSGGLGYLTYGAGGSVGSTNDATSRQDGLSGAGAGIGYRGSAATPGVANTGGGGGAGLSCIPTSPAIPIGSGGSGGSGYCLVRWLE